MNRRKFLLRAGVAGGVLAAAAGTVGAMEQKTDLKPLKVLLLGGTGYIGSHFTSAAVARGHRVSVFSRGKMAGNELPDSVEHLVGDRDRDLKAIQNRDWDAVLDLATYGPGWVRTLGQALKGRVKHYTFISSILAYQFPGATDENSKLQKYAGDEDPYTVTKPNRHYGALKVLCEEEAERQFPGKVAVLRPGTIVGPGEKVGSLTYWVARMERGGEVLAAGNPLGQVQFIDVRDLAEWAIRLAEGGKTGTFTAVGPAKPLSWAEMLGGMRAAFAVPTTLTWVPSEWLVKRKVSPWNPLLFWPEQVGYPGSTELNVDKACANGLVFRPFHTTIVDTVNWYKALPPEMQPTALLSFSNRKEALEEMMKQEAELLAAWRRKES